MALVFDVEHPIGLYGARLAAALATHDDPIDGVEIHVRQRANQGLTREELGVGLRLAQRFDAVHHLFVFYRNAHPDIVAPVE